MTRGSAIEGGGGTDAFEQFVRNDSDTKLSGKGLSDQRVTALGKDHGVDAGGDEVIEEMPGVIGCRGRGDRCAQDAVIIGDDGGEAMGTLPETANVHGRNSSSAV